MAQFETTNGATGGDTTAQGLQRLQEKVLQQKPDLVLIGFGMNDHNREGFGVPLDAFAANLRTMIARIRADTGAEIVLFSAFPPNPKWHYGSHNMEAYAEATERVAREEHCAFADVYHLWMSARRAEKAGRPAGQQHQSPQRLTGTGSTSRRWQAIGLVRLPRPTPSRSASPLAGSL